jgi:hypothetical protein
VLGFVGALGGVEAVRRVERLAGGGEIVNDGKGRGTDRSPKCLRYQSMCSFCGIVAVSQEGWPDKITGWQKS